MTYADLSPDEQAALRWLVRVTLWYGHGHRTLPPSPALLLLNLAGLAVRGPGVGTWAATPAALDLWATRRPAPFWKDAA